MLIKLLSFISVISICLIDYGYCNSTFRKSPLFPSSRESYLAAFFNPVFRPLNNILFDGPASISQAPTTPTTNRRPTLEQMMYYNHYAASIYCSYELEDLSCEYCQKYKDDIRVYKLIRNTTADTLALVTVSDIRREIAVTFRGTTTILNVLLDVLLIQINYPGRRSQLKIHTGILAASLSLYDDVVASVGYELQSHPEYKVVVMGQSLGGAMARLTIFFFTYLNQFPNTELELYTYGEPRVGNKAFVDYMNQLNITTARIVSGGDIIPHTPSVNLLALKGDFYLHAQPEYWDNGEESRFCDTSKYEDPTCSNSLGPTYSMLDHSYYFDLSYVTCHQPILFTSISTVWNPVEVLPPLPKPISNFLSGSVNFFNNLLRPIVG